MWSQYVILQFATILALWVTLWWTYDAWTLRLRLKRLARELVGDRES